VKRRYDRWNPRDLTGSRFGRLTVLELYSRRTGTARRTRWRCRCECGKIRIVIDHNLICGSTKSCGCWNRSGIARIRHGQAKRGHHTPEFRAWYSMRARARGTSGDPRRYRDRGIRVCKRWDSFENFLADMGRKPSPTHSLDRKNNDKGYSPKNCRWATPKQQSRNTGTSKFVRVGKLRFTYAEWDERGGFYPGTVRRRVLAGWPPNFAVSAPARNRP